MKLDKKITLPKGIKLPAIENKFFGVHDDGGQSWNNPINHGYASVPQGNDGSISIVGSKLGRVDTNDIMLSELHKALGNALEFRDAYDEAIANIKSILKSHEERSNER